MYRGSDVSLWSHFPTLENIVKLDETAEYRHRKIEKYSRRTNKTKRCGDDRGWKISQRIITGRDEREKNFGLHFSRLPFEMCLRCIHSESCTCLSIFIELKLSINGNGKEKSKFLDNLGKKSKTEICFHSYCKCLLQVFKRMKASVRYERYFYPL